MAIDRELNMQLIAAALASARGDSFSDALAQGGSMPDRIKLRDAQVAQKQANAEQTQLQNIKLQQEIVGGNAPIQVPEREYSIQEQNQDLLIAEGFGLFDATQTAVAEIGSAVGLAPTGGYDSNIAKAAKKQINFDIKATAADAWRGKPNNFLLQQIIELIPESYAQGDAKASARYGVIRNNFASRMAELDGQITNAKAGSAAQANLVKTRANVKHMIDRLDVVQQGFKGITPKEGGLNIDSFYGVNITPGVELDSSEEGLQTMLEAYEEFLEG